MTSGSTDPSAFSQCFSESCSTEHPLLYPLFADAPGASPCSTVRGNRIEKSIVSAP